MKSEYKGAIIHITGVVQGVGFRPFVFMLANRFHLSGWVRNTSAGVDIEADGQPEDILAFINAITAEAPPLAQIDQVHVKHSAYHGHQGFQIIHSHAVDGAFQPISPDVSICPDCLRELSDPKDRRYRYPFINCTNCGPRFTIIEDIPYDRPNTTMASFNMCPDCAAEYNQADNRRFHAQPIACPVCGPHLWLESDDEHIRSLLAMRRQLGDDEGFIRLTRRLLAQGKILAIKGLGGFHLACDATNTIAVSELRRRKLRVGKPFALMLPDIHSIQQHCYLEDADLRLLNSIQRPIVILNRKPDSSISPQVSPGQNTLGVMLPYTPLHYLLLEPEPGFPSALVMTSANLSEEPIASKNDEARLRLAGIADAFLMHNRDIHIRCDDSVTRSFDKRIYPIRRSRGYAPLPIILDWESSPLLATGTELKNTFCLTNSHYAFLSHHIGDLQNYETLQSFEDGISHFERLFRIKPQAISHDLHPDYLATRYALERAEREHLPAIAIQHHHAHVAACMLDNNINSEEPVIGISFDGTGYGDDGAIWGGEILLATYTSYQRRFHLDYFSLPGGDRAILEPWRVALAWLEKAGIAWEDDLPPIQYINSQPGNMQALATLRHQLERGTNVIPSSSVGRLFDAVASLLGLRHAVNYEAQAAIELEAQAILAPHELKGYNFSITNSILDLTPAIIAILTDLRDSIPTPSIAARFHNTLAEIILNACQIIRGESGAARVALSGGVWQNITLLTKTTERLKSASFQVYTHQKVPANDGGVSLGQAVIASQILKQGNL